jgi:hypothetical protein
MCSVFQVPRSDSLSDDGAHHRQAAHAGQRADHVVQFDVHAFERLLHVLHMAAGARDMVGAQSQVVLQPADVGRRHEARAQQAVHVQRGAPLN